MDSSCFCLVSISIRTAAFAGPWIEPDIDFDGRLNDAGSFLRYRAKSNFKAQRRYLHAVDRAAGLICDQTVVLTGFYSRQGFEAPLRRIKFNDPETGKRLV